jgi:hypothetical protein
MAASWIASLLLLRINSAARSIASTEWLRASKSLHLELGVGRAFGMAGVSRQVMAALVALRRQDFARQRHGRHVCFPRDSIKHENLPTAPGPTKARVCRRGPPKHGEGRVAAGERSRYQKRRPVASNARRQAEAELLRPVTGSRCLKGWPHHWHGAGSS